MNIIILLLSSVLLLSSCHSDNVIYKYPKSEKERKREQDGSLLTGDSEGFDLLKKRDSSNKESVDINLWRAVFDVISYLPISSTDYSSGIIVTDWYTDSNFPNERFKFTITISSNDLKATSVKVKGYKEILSARNQWVNSKINDLVTEDIENKILDAARRRNVIRR